MTQQLVAEFWCIKLYAVS